MGTVKFDQYLNRGVFIKRRLYFTDGIKILEIQEKKDWK